MVYEPDGRRDGRGWGLNMLRWMQSSLLKPGYKGELNKVVDLYTDTSVSARSLGLPIRSYPDPGGRWGVGPSHWGWERVNCHRFDVSP